jgi:hypothetical protein
MDAIAGCAERPAMLYSLYTPSTWMASQSPPVETGSLSNQAPN